MCATHTQPPTTTKATTTMMRLIPEAELCFTLQQLLSSPTPSNLEQAEKIVHFQPVALVYCMLCDNVSSEFAERIIYPGASNINIKREMDELTPLYAACETGKLHCVNLLLQAGADTEARIQAGSSAIHVACILGHAAIVELLLIKGANVNNRTASEKTALHWAAIFNQVDVAKLLLSYNCDASLQTSAADGNKSALDYAKECGRAEVTQLLENIV